MISRRMARKPVAQRTEQQHLRVCSDRSTPFSVPSEAVMVTHLDLLGRSLLVLPQHTVDDLGPLNLLCGRPVRPSRLCRPACTHINLAEVTDNAVGEGGSVLAALLAVWEGRARTKRSLRFTQEQQRGAQQ